MTVLSLLRSHCPPDRFHAARMSSSENAMAKVIYRLAKDAVHSPPKGEPMRKWFVVLVIVLVGTVGWAQQYDSLHDRWKAYQRYNESSSAAA